MRIGIITMHHVNNLGSVLQAYALQHKIECLGHNVQIIDYIPTLKNKKNKDTIIQKIAKFLFNFYLGFPKQKFEYRLKLFKQNYYKCSSKQYIRESLKDDFPDYDIYCTGSDQVWNPRYIGDDLSYMLDFVPDNKTRISYAASFATDIIPSELSELYANALAKYQHITVREKNGIDMVKSLCGKTSKIVCDPTLLLSSEEWSKIGNNSKINIKEKYILVYLLGYMFDPRPYFYSIVQHIQRKLGFNVYYINGWIHDMKQPHSKVLFGVGPAEFIHLFENASFVITDSFHGTAFATIFKRPMFGIVKESNSGDGRLTTLLRKVGNEEAIIQYNKEYTFDENNISKYQADEILLNSFRNESINVLSKLLNIQ